MAEISKEKREWMELVGIEDISKFKYMNLHTGHLFSEAFINETSLEDLKRINESSVSRYSKSRHNNSLRRLHD